MASTDDPQALRERVETLEAELEELTSDEVTDEGGRSWTPADLMNIGLTRRQSLVAFSAIAGGATFLGGVKTGMSTAAAETSGSVGQVGTTDQRVDVFSDLIDANQVSTGDLNSHATIRPDATDLISELQAAHDDLSEGGVIWLPPGEWTHQGGTLNISKNITIRSLSKGIGGRHATDYPSIDIGGLDSPLIVIDGGRPSINGLKITGDDTQSEFDLIECHENIRLSEVSATNIGDGNLIHLETRDGDNVNGSVISAVGGRQLGRVVKVTDPGGESNSNSMQIEINTAFNCRTAAVDLQQGSANQITVSLYEGSSSPTAAIICNGQRNLCTVMRQESSTPAIQFDSPANVGIVGYNVTGDSFALNNPNNRTIDLYSSNSWLELNSEYRGFKLGGVYQVTDDGQLWFGSNNDYQINYNDTNDLLEIKATGGTMLAQLDKSGNLDIAGNLNENVTF